MMETQDLVLSNTLQIPFQQQNKKLDEMAGAAVQAIKTHAIFMMDASGNIISWNDGAENMKGYTTNEIIGKHISILYPNLTDSKIEATNNLNEAATHGYCATEGWRIKKDGSRFWASITITALYNSLHELTGFVKITNDISSTKNYIDKINKKNVILEKRIINLIDKSSEAIAIYDKNFKPVFRNKTAEIITGITTAEMLQIENSIKTLAHPDEYEAIEKRNAEVLANPGKPISFTTKFKAQTGNYILLEGTITNYLNDESINGIIANFRDVTLNKKQETINHELLVQVALGEKKFRTLIENSTDAYALLDEHFVFKYRSPRAETISGRTEEAMNEQSFFTYVHPNDIDHVKMIGQKVLNNPNILFSVTFRCLHKNENYIWIECTLRNMLHDDLVKGIIANYRDITDKKITEEQLVAREKKFRAITENSSDITMLLDEDFKPIYTSQSAYKITGWTNEEREQIPILLHIHPADMLNLSIIKDTLKNKAWQTLSISFKLQHKAGHYIDLEGVLTNRLNDPDLQSIIANFRDVTERKIADEKLKRSEHIYKTIVANIPGSAICILDTNFKFQIVEGPVLEKFGYSRERLLGNAANEVMSEKRFEFFKRMYKKALKGEFVSKEVERKGEYAVMNFVPLKDENANVYAVLQVVMDITAFKKAQNDIVLLNNSLEEKVTERTQQFEESNRELEAFTYSVSHDLRAPLRIIDGYADILLNEQNERLDDEGKRVLQIIMSNTKRMGKLIDELLHLSKMGRRQLLMQNIDMNVLVKYVIKEQQMVHGATAKIILHPLHNSYCDNLLIRQVWANLISNAMKYSSKNTEARIEISSQQKDDKIIYAVKDNGVGFNMEFYDKLFGVFQRLHKATAFEGNGVGLALVQRVIKKHDGLVWANSEINKGAEFFFSLPIKHNSFTE